MANPCGKCGQVHKPTKGDRPCKGHKRFHVVDGERIPYPDGEQPPCTKTAMVGQDVCASHGGRAPQNRDAAATRIAEERAAQLMTTYGQRIDVDPGEEMLDLICWTAGHVRWLRARVQEIGQAESRHAEDEEDETIVDQSSSLIWGKTKHKVGGEDTGVTYEAKPNIWLALYGSETDRLHKLCYDAVKIGLKEREVKLAERQGDMFMKLIDGVIAELGHNPSDPAVAGVIVRHLQAVS